MSGQVVLAADDTPLRRAQVTVAAAVGGSDVEGRFSFPVGRSGLGLPASRLLAERVGGALVCLEPGPLGGARFELLLRVSNEAADGVKAPAG